MPQSLSTRSFRIDEKQALERVMKLMAISGKSGQEKRIADEITRQLKAAGVPASAITHDNAHKKSPLDGEIGNLICKLPGTFKAPRRLLMAHLDTVPLCVGSKPRRKGKTVESGNPETALGADDRSGCAAILTAAVELLRQKLPHPPLTFLFPVQEEVGMLGARFAQIQKLGQPKLCFNWDSGPAYEITLGATGGMSIRVTVHGIASHAGVHPEHGASAITIAACAISELQEQGWLGLVKKGRHSGTSNIGVIEGGDATNVITDKVILKGEARSHHRPFRARIVSAYQAAFAKAVKKIRNHEGRTGRIEFEAILKYEPFEIGQKEPCAVEAARVIKAEGLSPCYKIVNGGLDANWMTEHGLPTVTLGSGQKSPHTVDERLFIEEYLKGCRIALRLAAGL